MKFITWLGGVFKDENGNPSSKRIVGIMCSIFLCLSMYFDKAPSNYLVDAVALLAFGGLGLTSIDKIFDKIWGKRVNNKTSDTSNN
jgi:hypothetical protein